MAERFAHVIADTITIAGQGLAEHVEKVEGESITDLRDGFNALIDALRDAKILKTAPAATEPAVEAEPEPAEPAVAETVADAAPDDVAPAVDEPAEAPAAESADPAAEAPASN